MYLFQLLGDTAPTFLCLNWLCLDLPLWVHLILAGHLCNICILSMNLNSQSLQRMEKYRKRYSAHHASFPKVQNSASLNKEGEERTASDRD